MNVHGRFKLLDRSRLIKSEYLDNINIIRSADDASRMFYNCFDNRLGASRYDQDLLIVQKRNEFPYFLEARHVFGFRVPDDAPGVSDNALIIGPRSLADHQTFRMVRWGWKTQWIFTFLEGGRAPDADFRKNNQITKVYYQSDYQRPLVCHRELGVRTHGRLRTAGL